MRRVHQREADVVLAQRSRVSALVGAREQLQVRAAAELDAAPPADVADAVQLPSAPNAPCSSARSARARRARTCCAPRGARAARRRAVCAWCGRELGRGGGSTAVIAFSNAADAASPASAPLGVDADAVAAEVVAQQLGREQGGVREAVGLVGERRVGAHRERERLVLLDQVEEALAAERADGGRGDVRASTTSWRRSGPRG